MLETEAEIAHYFRPGEVEFVPLAYTKWFDVERRMFYVEKC